MGNVIVSELKDKKVLLLSLIGLLLIIFVGFGSLGGSSGLAKVFNDLLFDRDNATTSNDSTSWFTDINDLNNESEKDGIYSSEPDMNLEDGVDYQARITTNYGEFTIDLFEEDTPKTVNNFVFLADDDFYDGLTFHRVIEGFIIQGGDPAGDGSGGPGYTLDDEIDAVALGLDDIQVEDATYLRYLYVATDDSTAVFSPESLEANASKTLKEFYEDELDYNYTSGYGTHEFGPYMVAMANSGADSAGSQFFITSKSFNEKYLDGRYTVFGEVISGESVIDDIEAVSVGLNDKPYSDVMIENIVILEK